MNDYDVDQMDPQTANETPYYRRATLIEEMVEVLYKERPRIGRRVQPSTLEDEDLAKKLYDLVVVGVFTETVETGQCRLPWGIGVLKLVRMPPWKYREIGTKRLKTVTRERLRVKFIQGVTLDRLLGYAKQYKYKNKTNRVNPMDSVRPRAGV